jgi:chitinase
MLRRLIPALCGLLMLPLVLPAQSSNQHLLVGYFPQWGIYDQPQYLVKDLVSTGSAPLLNQINYAQGFVTNHHCSIADPNADLNLAFTSTQSVNGIADNPTQPFRGNLHQLQLLKQRYPHLRIIISLEGRAADFAADAQPEIREAFVASCVDLFVKGNLAPGIAAPGLFDGIDVDWEYPHAPDADNYKALLLELRRQMDAVRPHLLLTVAVGPSPHMYPGTDMAAISHIVDQVGLMTYDFNGPWNQTTGLIAPLVTSNNDEGGTVAHSISAYLAAGVPAAKLLMGLPFYGYGWHLVPEVDNGLSQEGEAIGGDHPYRDIEAIVPKSTVYRDPQSQAPWLFDGDSFWTYEDPLSIRHKAAYAVAQHLGGLMIWELGEDNAGAALLHAAHAGLTQPTPEPSPQPPAPSARSSVTP